MKPNDHHGSDRGQHFRIESFTHNLIRKQSKLPVGTKVIVDEYRGVGVLAEVARYRGFNTYHLLFPDGTVRNCEAPFMKVVCWPCEKAPWEKE